MSSFYEKLMYLRVTINLGTVEACSSSGFMTMQPLSSDPPSQPPLSFPFRPSGSSGGHRSILMICGEQKSSKQANDAFVHFLRMKICNFH